MYVCPYFRISTLMSRYASPPASSLFKQAASVDQFITAFKAAVKTPGNERDTCTNNIAISSRAISLQRRAARPSSRSRRMPKCIGFHRTSAAAASAAAAAVADDVAAAATGAATSCPRRLIAIKNAAGDERHPSRRARATIIILFSDRFNVSEK